MKKNNAFVTLIKDLLIAAIAFGIGMMLLQSEATFGAANPAPLAFFVACIPFGWRWSSKIITACSLKGVAIKAGISVLVGMFAIFVVIGWDVIRCVGQLLSAGKGKNSRSAMAETY